MNYTATLYDKTGKNKLGELTEILDGGHYVEEERNGIFEISFDYPNGYPLADLLINENMVEVKPNDTQDLQKFRIYDTKCLMKDIITVLARHESFDLANDHVENVNLENASCEYALNTLFRNSHFSTHYRGYSDIINAQNYKIDNVNILNAIAGKEGSIIDTYGTGAEILRDGTNIHVLNKRGHDNEVTIEFGKNLTDFVLERDLTDLETRVGGFAKYTPEGGKETIVKSNWIDSPYIDNFAHPYINVDGRRDYSDKFKDGEIPTVEKLNKLCADEFKINKRDIPKSNYTIKFIALSKCVGYEGTKDKISLCDTVRIIDKRFNVDTKAKVIKYKYDFVKERYESMELGEPRTTLGDIIGGSNGEQGPPGKDGAPGKDGVDGNIEDFPDTLPNVPTLTANVKGWGSIDLSWTFEDKIYYTYELYASKTKDFKPNIFDLIHSGQSSSHLFQAKPGETWYFRVCAKNTHGSRTEFSPQVTIVTKKSDDFEEYFSTLGVGNLVANIFSTDYMEAGIVKGHWVDAKNLSVTDGNGKRTLDIDSFGNVALDVAKLQISSKNVATTEMVDGKANKETLISEINLVPGSVKIKSNKIDIEGATTIGDGKGNYVQVEGYGYNAYINSLKTMYMGGYIENGVRTPSIYMGASGFDANSESYSGSFFAMKNYGSYHHLAMRSRSSGQWSIIQFNEAGDITFKPHVKCTFDRPSVFRQGIEIRDEYDIKMYDWNGKIKGRISRGVFELSQIKSIDNTIIQVKDSVRNMTWGNTMGTDDGRWGTIYLSQAPDVSSDITLKENIVYTDEKSPIPSMINIIEDDSLTYRDMYEFYRDIYRSAEYNYLEDDKRVLGIIANDIVDTKVGKKIIRHNSDGKLSYSQETRVTVLEGALKEAINEIEYWKERYIDLESKVDFLMKKLK